MPRHIIILIERLRVWQGTPIKERLLILAFCYWTFLGHADDRLWVDARINNQQARLILDTGADRVILFREGAARLGLKVSEDPAGFAAPHGQSVVGRSEPCELTLWQTSLITSLDVLDLPPYLHTRADGVLGWQPLNKNILQIDAADLRVRFLPRVPSAATSWTQLMIRTNSGFLFLEIPSINGPKGSILVDTGFSSGVALAPKEWREWKAAHPNQPATLDSYFMPGAGLVVKQEMWAKDLTFGPLLLTDIPVMEANPVQTALGNVRYAASFGLAALKRFDFLVDGKRGVAYLRLKQESPSPYEHNRLGAVFVPPAPESEDLVANVVADGPAYEAGIRNGDVLLKIDQLNVTKWRTAPGILPFARFWARPAGTAMDLTLQRSGKIFRATVLLREILSPASLS